MFLMLMCCAVLFESDIIKKNGLHWYRIYMNLYNVVNNKTNVKHSSYGLGKKKKILRSEFFLFMEVGGNENSLISAEIHMDKISIREIINRRNWKWKFISFIMEHHLNTITHYKLLFSALPVKKKTLKRKIKKHLFSIFMYE